MRLKSEIWVKAYLRRCVAHGAFAAVLRHGDDDAGAIFIKIVRGDRHAAVFAPAPSGLDGSDIGRRFVPSLAGKFVREIDVQACLDREAKFDSDLWIVEVEDRDGRHFLGDELVE